MIAAPENASQPAVHHKCLIREAASSGGMRLRRGGPEAAYYALAWGRRRFIQVEARAARQPETKRPPEGGRGLAPNRLSEPLRCSAPG
ncbi:hypothetical protein WQQ_27650 [Hydrocarboniphaga effusa AP103]|uniref:Uncharacterized protein n=1 Tax=Hydrocarboniphaga effusa AP103 TaxID=1172194 RepID=I8T621_9GAMM|nr:hypothetical protein WQQ_27650 [Hydrocarboniphaga effusa AP103]